LKEYLLSSTNTDKVIIFLILFYGLLSVGHGLAETDISINSSSPSPYSKLFYTPESFNTSKNSNVTWTNNDSINHTVTFVSPLLKAGIVGPMDDVVSPGSNITYQFTEPGRYEYYCRFYPFMSGQVEIK
jgi:plastocyanin